MKSQATRQSECHRGDERARGCAGSSGKSICRRWCNDLKFSLTKAKGYFRRNYFGEVGHDKSEAATYDILSGKTDIRLHQSVPEF